MVGQSITYCLHDNYSPALTSVAAHGRLRDTATAGASAATTTLLRVPSLRYATVLKRRRSGFVSGNVLLSFALLKSSQAL